MSVKAYLSFTKRERTGIFSLIALLIVITVCVLLFSKPQPVVVNIRPDQWNKLTAKKEYSSYHRYKGYDSINDDARNTYRNNNNSYYKQYRYSGIKSRLAASYYGKKEKGVGKPGAIKHYASQYDRFPKPYGRPAVIDINTADTTAFIALPGIGSKLAARIVLFRKKLGGFYNVDQVREVYGLQDSVFLKIAPFLKCNDSSVRRLNINAADRDALKSHPYIRWYIANTLVAYRQQHGSFSSLDELEKIGSIDSGALKKIMPYLSLN